MQQEGCCVPLCAAQSISDGVEWVEGEMRSGGDEWRGEMSGGGKCHVRRSELSRRAVDYKERL